MTRAGTEGPLRGDLLRIQVIDPGLTARLHVRAQSCPYRVVAECALGLNLELVRAWL